MQLSFFLFSFPFSEKNIGGAKRNKESLIFKNDVL
jgi:hypothetical protein